MPHRTLIAGCPVASNGAVLGSISNAPDEQGSGTSVPGIGGAVMVSMGISSRSKGSRAAVRLTRASESDESGTPIHSAGGRDTHPCLPARGRSEGIAHEAISCRPLDALLSRCLVGVPDWSPGRADVMGVPDWSLSLARGCECGGPPYASDSNIGLKPPHIMRLPSNGISGISFHRSSVSILVAASS